MGRRSPSWFRNSSQGRYSEAEPLYHQTLALRQQFLGAIHPDVAQSLFNWGRCGTQGQLQEAQALLLRAWPIYQAQLDPNHPSIKALLRWVDQVQQALESSRSS